MTLQLPPRLLRSLEDRLGRSHTTIEAIAGGDTSAAVKVNFAAGPPLFVKCTGACHDALVAEALGLRSLLDTGSGLVIPRCVAQATFDDGAFLALEWLTSTSPTDALWHDLGRSLGRQHRATAAEYGFECGNFIGRLPQANTWSANWVDFFLSRRLQPQVAIAQDRGLWQRSWQPAFEGLTARLAEILPSDPVPSLVHGDLWRGNVMFTEDGPAVFDPAVYYGHREVDLAMSRLFGGFPQAFYHAYDEVWPEQYGSDERREVYNLYHLINHLNHFGGGYGASVERVLRRFS